MKKTILLALLAIPAIGFSQTNPNKAATLATGSLATKQPVALDGPKTLVCNDTLRYVQIKEQLLGDPINGGFFIFNAWQSDAESVSQAYLNTTSHTISAIEFYGGRSASSTTASITVTASVYNVDANYNPTTLLGSGTISLTGTTNGYRAVVLSTPVTVTGNYALVIAPTSTGGVVNFYTTDFLANQTYDENFLRYKSSYYPNSNGAWVNDVTLTTGDLTNFPDGVAQFEALIAPIVSYTINTNFTAVPSPACAGTQVAFTNTTSPMAVLSNRMYTFGEFREHFGLATADSNFVWSMGNGTPFIWSQNTNYTYPTAGSYIDTLLTLGGFWVSCLDIKATPITVNPSTNATFTYSSNTVCSGSSNLTPTTSSPGIFSSTPAGLNFVSTSTGEINMSTSADGVYNITYTTSGPCSVTSSQSFTITSAPDASFTYGSASYCKGSSNPSPVFGVGAGAGTFSSTAGLTINPSTGEINLAASAAGTYTVTNSIAASGSCPAASETFSVQVKDQPTAIISGGGSLCAGSSSTVNVNGALTGTGPWTVIVSTPAGNQTIPSTTNSITVPVGTIGAGTYTVVNVTDATGCSNTGTGSAVVTVNPIPSANAVANQTLCGGTATAGVSFTGPVAGTTFAWTNNTTSIGLGASGNGNIPTFTAVNTSGAPVTSTVTVTPTANTCVGTPITFTITVNPAPSVDYTAPTLVCVYSNSFSLTEGTPSGGSFSGTGVTGTTFNPATAGIGTHTITYSVTQNGCLGTATSNIQVSACVGIEDTEIGTLGVYPNPTTNQFTFEVSNANVSNVTVSIITIDGKTVYQNNFQSNQGTIDVATFARGTYFVRINADGKLYSSKLILD